MLHRDSFVGAADACAAVVADGVAGRARKDDTCALLAACMASVVNGRAIATGKQVVSTPSAHTSVNY